MPKNKGKVRHFLPQLAYHFWRRVILIDDLLDRVVKIDVEERTRMTTRRES